MRLVLLIGFVVATSTGAQTMYKCQVGGKVEYSDKPCATTEIKKIQPLAGPTRQDQARAQSRLQADLAAEQGQPSSGQQMKSASDPSKSADDEKVLVHTKAGWDRKTKAQIDASKERNLERARATGIAGAADQGANLTTCDAGGCLDNLGRHYTRSGPELIRMDGRVCRQTAQNVECN